MPLQLVLIAAGLALLLVGGDVLVRGASSLARALGVAPLVVGMSVVAFGTSAPELAVNVLAAWSGNGGISFGNIFGSNIANIGLVLAIAALIRPIPVKAPLIKRELPFMLLATALSVVLVADALVGRGGSEFDRSDGLVLLLLFCVFLYYTIMDVVRGRSTAVIADDAVSLGEPGAPRGVVQSVAFFAAGLLALLGGGRLTVDAAVELARSLGVAEAVVGLTVIAVGTSLPELATSVMAARRGAIDLAVGNVVGSNVFNLLFVLGTTSVIAPVELPPGGAMDLAVTATLSVLLLLMSISRARRIIRAEGAVLLALYAAYIVWRSASG